ncbi:hypothetical protein B0T22DRAFT_276802 [Podospora appendiculata]|uniref:Uncharacterized protein n=1 Tax=Podospora appendiculata TaxID=314037 RepID=A0AAE0X0V4_9PEZI|nr:hypothetical protein B0T22DRAFT_276802 [Podospora appendiculata]
MVQEARWLRGWIGCRSAGSPSLEQGNGAMELPGCLHSTVHCWQDTGRGRGGSRWVPVCLDTWKLGRERQVQSVSESWTDKQEVVASLQRHGHGKRNKGRRARRQNAEATRTRIGKASSELRDSRGQVSRYALNTEPATLYVPKDRESQAGSPLSANVRQTLFGNSQSQSRRIVRCQLVSESIPVIFDRNSEHSSLLRMPYVLCERFFLSPPYSDTGTFCQ